MLTCLPTPRYYSMQNVHGPLDDIKDMSMFSDAQIKAIQSVETSERRTFSKLLGAADHAVDDLVESLKKRDMWSNTFLLFSSDNGGCTYGGGYNTPLRGGKHFLFEGGVRVPAFITSPMLPANIQGTEYTGLVHITDMFATMIDMTGHDIPEDIDSISQWDAILGQADHPRQEILHNVDNWNFPTSTAHLQMMKKPRAALRQGDMKIILHHWAMAWDSPPTAEDGLRPGNKGVEDCADPPEDHLPLDWLFNITADPYEQNNLIDAPEYADVVKRMRAKVMHEAQNMRMSSWMNEDPAAINTWRMTGFISPWMTRPGGSQ